MSLIYNHSKKSSIPVTVMPCISSSKPRLLQQLILRNQLQCYAKYYRKMENLQSFHQLLKSCDQQKEPFQIIILNTSNSEKMVSVFQGVHETSHIMSRTLYCTKSEKIQKIEFSILIRKWYRKWYRKSFSRAGVLLDYQEPLLMVRVDTLHCTRVRHFQKKRYPASIPSSKSLSPRIQISSQKISPDIFNRQYLFSLAEDQIPY